jgi:hypothetical protein
VLEKHGLPLESIFRPGIKGPDFNREFLTLRWLVTGFEHWSVLPTAFDKVRAISDDQLCDTYSIGTTLEECCYDQASRFGIEKQKIDNAYWENEGVQSENYLPIPWAFAIYTLFMEITWRPDTTAMSYESSIESKYEFYRSAFGKERMVLMFGEDKPPYTAARLAAQEAFWREHGKDGDLISYAL